MLTTSPNMVSMMSMFMEFANQEHDQAVHGTADDSIISQIRAATTPLLAADVPALEQHVKQAIQVRKNLERSHANHAAAGTKYTAMTIDSDATKPLPLDIPKTLLVQPPIFAATQHLPADALAAFDAVAAKAARVYQTALVTQLGLAKTEAATQLLALCEGHQRSFEEELNSYFSEGCPPGEKTRLIESAKLDYATAVDTAKAKFDVEAQKRMKDLEANRLELNRQRLDKLKQKDPTTIAAAMQHEVNSFALKLKQANVSLEDFSVPLATADSDDRIAARAEVQNKIVAGIQSSLNGKGGKGRQPRTSAKHTKLAAQEKTAKKKKGKTNKKKPPVVSKSPQAPATSSAKKSKKKKKQGRRRVHTQQQDQSSAQAPKQTGGGRKRKRTGA
jgi:hypothetical protein